METIVAITKTENSIEDAVRRAIDLIGGMETIVNQDEMIYLKPNFVAPRDSSSGVTTDLEIVRVVAEEVRRCGGIPIIFETPAIEFNADTVFEVLGVYEFARKNGIRLINKFTDTLRVPIRDGKSLKWLEVPQLLHCAKIINLPKLKTHVSARMTCGLKNLIGLLPDSEKRRVHIWGVHECIADIAKVFRPVLTVVDAITCMQGDGPTYGDRIGLDLVLAGTDIISVDKVCSEIIGLPWEELPYLRMLDSEEPGSEIRLIGESIRDLKVSFKIPEKNLLYHFATRLMHIIDVFYSKIFAQHLNQFLFSTGCFGTVPRFVYYRCDGCGLCLDACPQKGVLNIDRHKVDYRNCIRCLNCFYACPKQAISVKGFSRPEAKKYA